MGWVDARTKVDDSGYKREFDLVYKQFVFCSLCCLVFFFFLGNVLHLKTDHDLDYLHIVYIFRSYRPSTSSTAHVDHLDDLDHLYHLLQ